MFVDSVVFEVFGISVDSVVFEGFGFSVNSVFSENWFLFVFRSLCPSCESDSA